MGLLGPDFVKLTGHELFDSVAVSLRETATGLRMTPLPTYYDYLPAELRGVPLEGIADCRLRCTLI